MAGLSLIEWTEATWNPVTGCSKISAGCKHCYAERMSFRLKAMGKPQYENGFKLTLQPKMLEAPLRWRSPRTIFVNSMSDLFHEEVGLDFTKRVFDVMNRCPQHTFQVLTKRPAIAAEFAPFLNWSSNIWMGTSVEDDRVLHRIASLRRIPAQTRFLSVEPLIGPLPRLTLAGHEELVPGLLSKGSRARPALGIAPKRSIRRSGRSSSARSARAVIAKIAGLHIALEAILVRDVELPPAIRTAIDSKLAAEQEVLKMKYVIAVAKQTAEQCQIEADSVASYNKTVASSLSPPILEYARIQQVNKLAASTNAKTVVLGGGRTFSAPILLTTPTGAAR